MNDSRLSPNVNKRGASAAQIVLGVASLAVAWSIASAVHDRATAERAGAIPVATRDADRCAQCVAATFHERYPLAADAALADIPSTF